MTHHQIRRELLSDGTGETECSCGAIFAAPSVTQAKRLYSTHRIETRPPRPTGGSEDKYQGTKIPPPTPLHRMGRE